MTSLLSLRKIQSCKIKQPADVGARTRKHALQAEPGLGRRTPEQTGPEPWAWPARWVGRTLTSEGAGPAPGGAPVAGPELGGARVGAGPEDRNRAGRVELSSAGL